MFQFGRISCDAFCWPRRRLAFTAISVPAFAQEAEDDGGIQEILVTAQKKEESLQKAAIAIDAVSGTELIQQGVTNALDIARSHQP
jgi:iron complex outermembrane receptor protein